MTYATLEALEELYGEEFSIVAAREDDSAQIDTVRVARVSKTSFATVNSFIGQRYDLPLNPPFDEILEGLEGAITMYNLPSDGLERTDHAKERYKNAMAHLKLLAKGEAKLRITPDGEAETADPSTASITSNERLMTRDGLGDVL